MKKNIIVLLVLAAVAAGIMFLLRTDSEPAVPDTEPAETVAPAAAEASAAKPDPADSGEGAAEEQAEEDDLFARLEQYDHEPVAEDLLPEQVVIDIPESPEGFDDMPILSPSSQLSRTIEQMQNSALVPLDEYGRTMLSSTNATLRAMGAILMFKGGALDETVLQQIADDEDVAVPILVLEWIRDYGNLDKAGELAGLLVGRGLDTEWLADQIMTNRFAMGGGRVAVDLLADSLSEEDRWDMLGEIAMEEDVHYALRMRSLLRLGEEPDEAQFRETLARIHEATANEGEDWEHAMDLLDMRVWNDEGTELAPRDEVTTRDLYIIFENDYTFIVQDAALYLESRLRNPDVVVEPGSSEIVAEFLKDFPDWNRDWNVEDEEALQRLDYLQERMAALEYVEAGDEESDAETGAAGDESAGETGTAAGDSGAKE